MKSRFHQLCSVNILGVFLFLSCASAAFSATPDQAQAEQAVNATVNTITAIITELDLTLEQQLNLAPIMTEQMSKAYTLYQNYKQGKIDTITQDLSSLREETYHQLESILTPTQMAKVKVMEQQAIQAFQNTPTQ